MIVHGVFAPPMAALEELLVQALAIEFLAEGEQEKRGLRRFGRSSSAPAARRAVLEPAPLDTLRLVVAGFGNLTRDDAQRLSAALRTAAAEWTPPRVFLAGVAFVPEEGRFWATFDGDVEGLTTVARDVGTSVERLGFFVDRRKFHPMIDLGVAARAARESDIARVVDAFQGFRGQEWSVDTIVLTTPAYDGPKSEEEPFERISIGHEG